MRLRSHLVLLVAAAVLPVVIFAGVMIDQTYRERRENLSRRLHAQARAIAAALDREFLVSIQSLKVLGASTRLDRGQLAEFYGDMQAALSEYSRAWQNLTLTDASGQQLINLRRPFGSVLPKTGNPAAIDEARLKRQPVIADLSPGPVTGALGIVVHVPVVKNGEVKYLLNAIFYPGPLAELLAQQQLPPSWVATIIDRNQIVAARTGDAKKYFGKPAPAGFQARAKEDLNETRRAALLDGTEVLAALHRSELTGWTVGVASPVEEIEGPLRDALLLTGAGGLILLLVASALAVFIGRRIAIPVAGLVAAAEQLGEGAAVPAQRSSIQEIDRVARALEDAGRKRSAAEARIRQLNRVYAVLSDINQAIVRIRDPQVLFSTACRIAVEKGEFRMAWIGQLNRATGRVEPRAFAGVNDGYLERLSIVAADPSAAKGPTATALASGGHVVCNDIESDALMARWREEALRRGYRSSAVFPLKIGGEPAGTFNLYSAERGFFDRAELALLDEMAADIGFFLESHRRGEERLSAEISLREAEERFRQLAENIDEVFWLTTPDRSRMLYVSPAYETIWGRSRQSLYASPRDWLHAVHPEDRERVLGAIRTQEAGGSREIEFRIARPDGEIRWMRSRAFPVRDETGEVYRVAGIAEDITEHRQAEEAVRRARDELEERVAERTRELAEANLKLRDLDRLKSEFLANMSHELRTPLNAIIGFSQLMYDGKAGGALSAQHKEYVGDVLQSGKHLLQLINDVLDVSKIEAGKMEMIKSTFPVDGVILEVVQNVAPMMSVKGLSLVRDIPENLPEITTDRRKLLQILLNLVSNAVKFTDRGKVTVSARAIAQSAERIAQGAESSSDRRPETDDRSSVLGLRSSLEQSAESVHRIGDGGRETGPVPGQRSPVSEPADASPDNPQSAIRNPQSSDEIREQRGESETQNPKPETYMEFSVADTGVGIRAEEMPLLFQPFSQVDSSLRKRHEGTGLGLYLSKKLVELLGGTITVESEYGKGSTFTVRVPAG
jgi:PAS domain S-box-containing protein